MKRCRLCPRMCGAYRGRLRGAGYCGCGTQPVVSRAALHMWEEPVISGSRGSGTIFFSGCCLGCAFCQNAAISSELRGRAVSPQELAEIMRELPALIKWDFVQQRIPYEGLFGYASEKLVLDVPATMERWHAVVYDGAVYDDTILEESTGAASAQKVLRRRRAAA